MLVERAAVRSRRSGSSNGNIKRSSNPKNSKSRSSSSSSHDHPGVPVAYIPESPLEKILELWDGSPPTIRTQHAISTLRSAVVYDV